MSTNNYTAILLDMNGVIIDDEHIHEAAFRQVLGEIGHTLTPEEYREHYVGRTDREGLQDHLASKGAAVAGLDTLLATKSAAYHTRAAQGIQSFAGVREFVEKAAARGLQLAVVTSANQDEAVSVLESLDIARFMGCLVSGDDIDIGKPSPEGYLKAAAILGVKPSHCVVIEDAPNGVLAAKNAGMYCVGITNTHSRTSYSTQT